MNTIINWLIQPTTSGATRLQVILLCIVLIGVTLYGVNMIGEIIEGYKQIGERENDNDEAM